MSTDLAIVDERAHWWLQARAHFQQLADLPMPEDADEIAWRLADFASISATLALAPDSVYAAVRQIQEARAQADRNVREFFAATFGDDEPDTDADHIPASRVQG